MALMWRKLISTCFTINIFVNVVVFQVADAACPWIVSDPWLMDLPMSSIVKTDHNKTDNCICQAFDNGMKQWISGYQPCGQSITTCYAASGVSIPDGFNVRSTQSIYNLYLNATNAFFEWRKYTGGSVLPTCTVMYWSFPSYLGRYFYNKTGAFLVGGAELNSAGSYQLAVLPPGTNAAGITTTSGFDVLVMGNSMGCRNLNLNTTNGYTYATNGSMASTGNYLFRTTIKLQCSQPNATHWPPVNTSATIATNLAAFCDADAIWKWTPYAPAVLQCVTNSSIISTMIDTSPSALESMLTNGTIAINGTLAESTTIPSATSSNITITTTMPITISMNTTAYTTMTQSAISSQTTQASMSSSAVYGSTTNIATTSSGSTTPILTTEVATSTVQYVQLVQE